MFKLITCILSLLVISSLKAVPLLTLEDVKLATDIKILAEAEAELSPQIKIISPDKSKAGKKALGKKEKVMIINSPEFRSSFDNILSNLKKKTNCDGQHTFLIKYMYGCS